MRTRARYTPRFVGSYVSTTRSLALQRRDLVTLAVDPWKRTLQ